MEVLDIKPNANFMKEQCQNAQDIKLQMVTLQEQMQRFKERVSKYIEDIYVEFLPNTTNAYLYADDGSNLQKQGYLLLNSLSYDDVSLSDKELVTAIRKFKKVLYDLDVTNRILAADEIFQLLEESSSNEHMIALDLLKKLNNIIHHSASADVQKLLLASPAYDNINVRYLIKLHMVKSNLRERFRNLVQLSEKQLPGAACSTLQVSKDINKIQDTVIALFQAKYDVAELCDFLLDKCLIPMITRPVDITFSEDNPEYIKLQISYNLSDTGIACPAYKQVFENIKLLFHCLDNLNVLVSDDKHFFAVIGEIVATRFLQTLIDKCLMKSIPETIEDFQNSSLVEDVLHFEHLLADLFLINREIEQRLTKFTENFETLFHNRLFHRLLETGREIMQKDLQDMTLMAEKTTPGDVENNPILFPKCMVSKTVLDFVKLLNRIIRQSSDSHDDDNRYFNTVSVLINSYITLVPQYHKENLEKLPQHAALFYNNCMFLIHFLAKNYVIPTAANLVKNLESCASKHLRQQIDLQLTKLHRILQPNQNGKINNSKVDKCLVHLHLLENLWQHVLSAKEYRNIMGELINSCSLLLNQQIIGKETITGTEAKEMAETFGIFKTKAACLFKVGQDLQNLTNWQRLIHLLDLLQASLTEITEMWSVGTISEYFKAEEVIALIRSIHPNTERRSLALNRIF
ncbi:centromere/kinetochore protein zw10-like [Haematobia irritans]|uniref:centromere/kinetochore protein zw10-like n=1 Tax=Haematobia irritans TaxID=7368 RepID=UPI003F5084C6